MLWHERSLIFIRAEYKRYVNELLRGKEQIVTYKNTAITKKIVYYI